MFSVHVSDAKLSDYDGHCKNKSTLTDTSANFTDQPHLLSLPSVQPTSLVTFQATQRFPETTSPHFTFEFPSLSHKLSASDHKSSPDPSQPFPDHVKLKSHREK